MSTSSLILQSYLKTQTDKSGKLRYDEKVDELIKYNRKAKGGDFLVPLSYYLNILENTHEVLIDYMSPERKERLLRDLQIAYLLLLTEKKYEQQHQKYENLKIYAEQIKRCQELIDQLNYEKKCEEEHREPSPEHDWFTDGYPVKYLTFILGQVVAGKIIAAMDRKTKTIKEAMGWFNEKRLYWVWGSQFLKTFIQLLPDDFFNSAEASRTIRTPDPYTGCLSWGLYYFRFSLNLFLLLKHTISHPWMSDEEKKTPWTERFLTQWDQRKFTLLNDSIWATGNLICFFWLTGATLGAWGDALTLALLVFDITMTLWDYEEQKTKFNKEMLAYDTDIAELKLKIKGLKEEDSAAKVSDEEIREYELQLLTLQRSRSQCQREWDMQQISLINNIAYAIGLMIAFALLTTPFMPASTATLVIGAVLCLAFTIIYNAVKGGIEVYKANATEKEVTQDFHNKIIDFKKILEENPNLEDNEKRFLFLEIRKLHADSKYQKQMVVFQTMHLIRSVIIETMVPALIFTSLVFMPLGIGIGTLAAALAIAMVTNMMVNRIFKPDQETVKPFDEEEYRQFAHDPDHYDWYKKSSQARQSFFKPVDEPQPTTDSSTEVPLLGSGLN